MFTEFPLARPIIRAVEGWTFDQAEHLLRLKDGSEEHKKLTSETEVLLAKRQSFQNWLPLLKALSGSSTSMNTAEVRDLQKEVEERCVTSSGGPPNHALM